MPRSMSELDPGEQAVLARCRQIVHSGGQTTIRALVIQLQNEGQGGGFNLSQVARLLRADTELDTRRDCTVRERV